MDSSFAAPHQVYLDQISTHWPQIDDPVKFVLRYGPAIQRYVLAILRDPQEAEDACQDFLLKVFEKGFQQANVTRGRFRDYLKSAARNAALTRLRRRPKPTADASVEELADDGDVLREADELWCREWRTALLERVWQAIDIFEQHTPDSLYHTVLRLVVERPKDDSSTLAGEISQRLGRPYRPDAFRKQVSRARRFFARIVVYEVRQTLTSPTADAIEAELLDLNLMKYVRDYLPADWRQTGEIPQAD